MKNTTVLYQQAQQLQRQNQPEQAWDVYQRIIHLDFFHVQGLMGLGQLLHTHKKFQESIPYLERVTKLQPFALEAWYLLGLSYSKIKDQRAEAALRKAIQLAKPKSPQRREVMYQLARVLRDKKVIEAAEKLINRILGDQANHAKALTLKGQFQQQRNENEAAYHNFKKALAQMPNHAAANHNLACMARVLKKQEEAIQYFQRALDIHPQRAESMRELAILLSQEGQPRAAENLLKKAIQCAPDHPENYRSIAQWYAANGDRRKTIKYYQKLVQLLPDDEKAQAALGSALAVVGAYNNAIPYLKKSLELAPNAEAACTLVSIHIVNKQLLPAIPLLQQALEMDADFIPAIYQSITLRAKLGDWSQRIEDERVWAATALQHIEERDLSYPLPLLDMNFYQLPMSVHLQLNQYAAKEAKKRAQSIIKQTNFIHQPRQHQRLRIGYISPDFHHHPVGRIVQHLFQAHHRKVVEVYAYSLCEARDGDEIRIAIQAGVDHFRELSFASNAEVAQQIYTDEIDVLIDLGGYTAFARPEVMAAQPAPVQAHFLGYPNTSGSDFLQYIIADEQLIPTTVAAFYSEKIVHLPHAFPGVIPQVAVQPLNRALEGLAEAAFVFAGFNRAEKLEPQIFESWLRIVNAVPNGILWLGLDKTVQDNLLAYAQAHQLDTSRLKLSDWADYNTFLHRLRHADLFLDTLHYGAGATAVASIAMGTPVLTVTADNFTARLAASVVSGAHQEELICPDLETYEQKAIALANSPEKMKVLRNQLQTQALSLPLFDMDTFTHTLEAAYGRMYQNFAVGRIPEHITIKD